jgi:hypothetical protein
MQTWFGTGYVSGAAWGRIVFFGLLIFLLVELEKIVVARVRRQVFYGAHYAPLDIRGIDKYQIY